MRARVDPAGKHQKAGGVVQVGVAADRKIKPYGADALHLDEDENVSGMDGHSLECEADRGARQMRAAASIDIHLFLRSLRRLLHRITIESVPLSS